MGIYTNSMMFTNEAYDYASEIPANEAYDAAFGCAHILADCQANDMALFESAIYSDFEEVRSLQEGYGYINENAFTDVLKKIAEMFKKLLAKIKGIFAAFIAKLTGAFADGKKLVKKYEKQIIKYSNWKDFKCKGVYQPKSGTDIIKSINDLFKYSDSTVGVNASIYKLSLGANSALNNEFEKLFKTKDPDKFNDLETEDIKNALLDKYTALTDAEIGEFHQNVRDALYDDGEKEIDGEDSNVSSSFFTAAWIKGVLIDDKWMKNVKKFNERLEKNINMIIDNLNKGADDLASWRAKNGSDVDLSALSGTSGNDKNFADSDNGKIKKSNTKDWNAAVQGKSSTSSELVQKSIGCLQKVASNEQEVISKVTSEYMSQVKFAIAQARKIWTAAAAWSSGIHKESVEFAQAVAECTAEQFYTNMEAIH